MDGPKGYFAEWSESGREREIPYVFTYMWNLINKITKQNSNILIDIENI